MNISYNASYLANQILLNRPSSSIDSLISTIASAKVDLNPHQVDAALFAFHSPLSNGALLADEVGLGKTIEAGIVIAQCWAEHKRKILLIVPASLRNQWLSELDEKFYIKSVILESKNYNNEKKNGNRNPFDCNNRVVICSYNFAAKKDLDVSKVNWDLVVIDEAHRLRNVYKSSNVIGNKLKSALSGRKKLLLTATPFQNNLMELYGLVSIIDERVFSDAKSFRDKYVKVENEEMRNVFLRAKLQSFCKRTLRKQVTEYVPYTKREAILTRYEPSADEEKLYNDVSDYLSSEKLYALPNSQRKLMTMILRKLLASSSFAISGTLDSLILRLENMLNGIDTDLKLDDYDSFEELLEEVELTEDDVRTDMIGERQAITDELNKLKEYAELAKRINTNAKGENLLTALKKGFDRTSELGGQRKAVIFTESRRTQEYLFNLLSNNGYSDQIVFLNGSNSDDKSKKLYSDWLERHKGEDIVSGSRQADIKAAIVEEFKNNACILIGTEAAAEGINLQFCSLLVNYDMPWNPQRIEQRIGRCHRYGQKNDVVVLNFVNEHNEADKHVYELLDQKFKLFDGLFGSSDEVLGSLENGIDFETRIAEIYQNCRTTDEIQAAFDELQDLYKDKIESNLTRTRQSILENFDEDVSKLLKVTDDTTKTSLNRFETWLYYFLLYAAPDSKAISDTEISANSTTYNLRWRDVNGNNEVFMRKDEPYIHSLLENAVKSSLPVAEVRFDYSSSGRKFSYFESMPVRTGWLRVDKLTVEAFDIQEYIINTCVCDDGTVLDDDTVERMMELCSDARETALPVPDDLEKKSALKQADLLKDIEEQNKKYFLDECSKLDEWSEELKENLYREIKDLDNEIKEKTKAANAMALTSTLAEMLEAKDEVNKLKKLRDKKRRHLYDEEDRIAEENERLQEEMRKKLIGRTQMNTIFTIRFEIR